MEHDYRKLEIWIRSRKLVGEIYVNTNDFPNSERNGLVDQMRRAAVSIPSNIAEGCGRNSNAQLIYFINISFGSLCEIETQILISFDLKYIDEVKSNNLLKEVIEIKKMTWSFQEKISKAKKS